LFAVALHEVDRARRRCAASPIRSASRQKGSDFRKTRLPSTGGAVNLSVDIQSADLRYRERDGGLMNIDCGTCAGSFPHHDR
jgi:hypothetical protein